MDKMKDRRINAGFLSHNDFATTYLCQVYIDHIYIYMYIVKRFYPIDTYTSIYTYMSIAR